MSMISFTQALTELNITGYMLDGTPTTEAEFKAMFAKLDKDGNKDTNPDNFGVTWSQLKAKYDELVNDEPITDLRAERNRLLAETDWWAGSDLTITDAQKKYRQDLRDITKSATSLDDVTWPTKP